MQQPIIHEPVAVFLTIVAVILVAPLLLERIQLPGIVGLIVGGILIGPHGLGLLATSGTMELLSTVGLIYLMFSAGLEIDLAQFGRVRNKAITFGLLSFAIPQLSGFLVGRLLSLDLPASILLGSMYASHTLIAFPLLSRLGIMKDEAVATTVAATVFTDVASLLVLAVIVGAQGGQQSTGAFIAQLVGLMIAYTLVILLGLPKLGKLFFRRFSGRNIEFQFVLVALFVAAVAAELIGMHAIVGAFLAGLAINSTLPEHSPVSGRVLFVGESLFIPIFLIFVGMSTDPLAVIADRLSLLTGILLTAAVYSTKFVASWLTAKLFGYGRNETMTMWGLSQAQAAATLATLLVALEVGLLPQSVFNGAIMMVLATSITSPMIVERFGRQLEPKSQQEEEPAPMFGCVVVPVANPETQEDLIRLGSLLAKTGEGKLVPVHVARELGKQVEGMDQQDRIMNDVSQLVVDLEVESDLMRKVAPSVAKGIRQAALEARATTILMGWHGPTTFRQQVFGTVIDEVVWNVEIPVMVARVASPVSGWERVYLGLPSNSVSLTGAAQALEAAVTLAKGLKVPLRVLADSTYKESAETTMEQVGDDLEISLELIVDDLVSAVTSDDRPGAESLVIIPSTGSSSRYRWSVGTIPTRLVRKIEDSVLVVHFP